MSTATPTVARWEGHDVTVARVSGELARLRDPGEGAEPLTLASVLTLVAVAPDPEGAREMEGVIRAMADHQPSRAVLLTLAGDGGPTRLDAALESAARPGCEERCVWVELVALTLRGAGPEAAASALVPLLRFDLPTFLWWPSAPDASPELAALAAVADRLVTEGAALGDGGRAVGLLDAWCAGGGAPPTDLAWAAITPWRQLVAQLVDAGALARLRAAGGRLTLRHPGPGPSVEALLMAGWLCDVLGADLDVRLEGASAPGAPGLLALGLTGLGQRDLRVERIPGRDVAEVLVREADGPTRRRVLPLPTAGRAALLAGELELGRRDRLFERALPHATRLARAASAA